MNIESLEKQVANNVTEIKLPDDQTVRLRRLPAVEGLRLAEFLGSLGYGPEGGPKDSPERMVALHSWVLSKSIVDHKGNATLDSDRGRELLAQLNFRDLVKLGRKAIKWSGLDTDDDAKKNLPATSDSPTSSVEPLPHDTEALQNS